MRSLIEKYVARHTPAVSRDEIVKEVRANSAVTGVEVASRYTRGNVSIQSGEMIFEEDLGLQGAPHPHFAKRRTAK